MQAGSGWISVLRPALRTCGPAFLLCSAVQVNLRLTRSGHSLVLQLVSVLATQLCPIALNLLIGFISSGEQRWKGFLYTAFLVTANVTVIILNNQYLLQQVYKTLRELLVVRVGLCNKWEINKTAKAN